MSTLDRSPIDTNPPPKAKRQPVHRILLCHRHRGYHLRHVIVPTSHLPARSSLRSPTGSQARLHRYDLPPSRELTPKDKYYVVQIGLQPGVYKGEAEARRHMGTSRLAFAHIEATRKVANARYLSLVESREVFEAI
ncbi:hypothetical protein BKA70DRAFT_1241442 [Coprinopsis sp. MPI-PUGE-AT-0042]|nr:hypothetical protein BKA70DRAFT_1241442 [Coprinopsis sp. MPI-PUGE-AT-0042]